MIEEAHAAGQNAFGENQAQEAVQKITQLAHLPLEWHFIGPIQSNKTRAIAERFQWVHSVEREKIAARLDAARPAGLPPLNVCIQVNVSGEASKSGRSRREPSSRWRRRSRGCRGLRLRGLMAIPEPTPDAGLQRRRFALLRELKDRLVARGVALDTLSMGMSDDLEAAILEGATMVRVGTAIFGPRKKTLNTEPQRCRRRRQHWSVAGRIVVMLRSAAWRLRVSAVRIDNEHHLHRRRQHGERHDRRPGQAGLAPDTIQVVEIAAPAREQLDGEVQGEDLRRARGGRGRLGLHRARGQAAADARGRARSAPVSYVAARRHHRRRHPSRRPRALARELPPARARHAQYAGPRAARAFPRCMRPPK